MPSRAVAGRRFANLTAPSRGFLRLAAAGFVAFAVSQVSLTVALTGMHRSAAERASFHWVVWCWIAAASTVGVFLALRWVRRSPGRPVKRAAVFGVDDEEQHAEARRARLYGERRLNEHLPLVPFVFSIPVMAASVAVSPDASQTTPSLAVGVVLAFAGYALHRFAGWYLALAALVVWALWAVLAQDEKSTAAATVGILGGLAVLVAMYATVLRANRGR